MVLSTERRAALPASDFAVPGQRRLPIPDERHVRMAWSQLDRTSGLSDAERAEAKTRIMAKAKALGVDTAGWEMHAASDAGLYVRRNLTPESAASLTDWAVSQGFSNITPAHEMHATVVHSRVSAPLAPMAGEVKADTAPRTVGPLGDKGAIVLHFVYPDLEGRHAEALEAGAVSDYDGFSPHVTITYDLGDLDLDDIEPYAGDLTFGPEIHEPLNETSAEDKGLQKMQAAAFRFEDGLEAMAIDIPQVRGHPNRMPFSGVLTRLDQASDKAPQGSNGKRVIMTRAAAERALPSLMGMAVNFTSSFDGHDVQRKIGVFTGATIEGDAVRVSGFIYARDFPQEASRIQTDKRQLGFSWELADIYVESLDADPLVITDATFTGAAILRKDKAAFASTSLAASAEEIEMTLEEMKAAMTAAMEPVTTALTTINAEVAKQAATIAELQASAATQAEATAKAAADAAAKARDEEFEAMKTQLADLKAAAEKKGEPERKTLSPQISAILARADLSIPDGDGKLQVGAVDAALSKAGIGIQQRIQVKNDLQRAGAL